MNKLDHNSAFSPQLGVLTLAYGDERYIKQAELLAISIKINMPSLPVALVSDVKELNSPWFDCLIPLDDSFGKGLRQKLYLDKYSPFFETLYVDSDCIVTRDFSKELQEISAYDFTPVCETFLDYGDKEEYLDDLQNTMKKLAITSLPKFNGGVFFFKQNESAAKVFAEVRGLPSRQSELGIRNFDKHGPNDETLYALALGMCGYPLYNDHGRLMRPTVHVSSRIHIHPLGRGCKFTFYGKEVHPAICHFVRSNVSAYAYLKCEWVLRRKVGQYRKLNKIVSFFMSAALSLCIGQAKMIRYNFWVLSRKRLRNR